MMADSTMWVDITTLKLWDGNPNQGDIGSIMTSISSSGFNDTCHFWRGIVKAGNHSVMALTNLRSDGWHPDKCKMPSKCLKIEDDTWYISMIDISEMDALQSDIFGIAINKTQRSASWNEPALAALLQEIANSTDVVLEVTGFDESEVDDLLRDLGQLGEPPEDPGAQIDRAAELQEKWQVQRGDVWEIPSSSGEGVHRIMCGDSCDVADVELLMGGVKADAVVTDPPYGVDHDGSNVPDRNAEKHDGLANDGRDTIDDFSNNTMLIIDFIARDGCPIYVFCTSILLYVWQPAFEKYFKLRNIPVWVKDTHALSRSDYHWKYESILYGTKPGAKHIWNGERTQNDVWEFRVVNSFGYIRDDGTKRASSSTGDKTQKHPTQKPLDLIRYPIEMSSNFGDLVVDPFLGSGTMIVACEQTGRVGFGMELMPKYVSVCLQRLSDMGLQPERGENGGT